MEKKKTIIPNLSLNSVTSSEVHFKKKNLSS